MVGSICVHASQGGHASSASAERVAERAGASGVGAVTGAGSDFGQLSQGLDGIAEVVAAEAAVRAATEGGEIGADGGAGLTAEAAALSESGGAMGATHVWQ